jgi:hypothetical protein
MVYVLQKYKKGGAERGNSRIQSCIPPVFHRLGNVAPFISSFGYLLFDFVQQVSEQRVSVWTDQADGNVVHCKSSHEQNFVMGIFVQRGLTVLCATVRCVSLA